MVSGPNFRSWFIKDCEKIQTNLRPLDLVYINPQLPFFKYIYFLAEPITSTSLQWIYLKQKPIFLLFRKKKRTPSHENQHNITENNKSNFKTSSLSWTLWVVGKNSWLGSFIFRLLSFFSFRLQPRDGRWQSHDRGNISLPVDQIAGEYTTGKGVTTAYGEQLPRGMHHRPRLRRKMGSWIVLDRGGS